MDMDDRSVPEPGLVVSPGMTITHTYWQDGRQPREPWTRCSPNLSALLAFLLSRFGGQSLGCFALRPIRGGSAWSSHAFGAAFDWRYSNVGGGRVEVGERTFRDVVLPFLILNADVLGIQQIHDYRAGRIWRTGRGWRASTAEHMGESWALYIHVETNVASWSNSEPIERRAVSLPTTIPPTDPNPPFDPEAPLHEVTFSHRTLALASPNMRGRDVALWQRIMQNHGEPSIAVDGYHGPQTDAALRRVQERLHVTVDGYLGPQTAKAMLSQ